MDPLLVFAAGDLDTAGIPVDRELPPAWLVEHLADVEAQADRPGRVQGRLSRSSVDDVVVRCEARATVTVPCARCLGPASIDLEAELSLLLRPGKVLPTPARAVRDPEANGNGAARKAGPGTLAIEAAKTMRAAKGGGAARAGAGRAPGPGGRGGAGRVGARADAAPRAERRPVGGAGRVAAGATRLPEFEFSSDEADVDLYDGETVVLDGFVREALLLEMPNFPLCSEDCPGIRAVPADAGSTPGEASPTPSSGSEAEPARAPGTKSLGDALRAALSAKSGADRGAPTTKKR